MDFLTFPLCGHPGWFCENWDEQTFPFIISGCFPAPSWPGTCSGSPTRRLPNPPLPWKQS